MRRPARQREKRRLNLGRLLLLLILVVGLMVFFFFLKGKYWNGKSELNLVINKPNGDVLVAAFDPSGDEITTILIPGNTQVQVARQLGTWKIGSVWKLGQDEKLSGTLLAETVTKNFRFPVTFWADEPAYSLTTGDFWSEIRAFFMPCKTNLGLGDRLRIALFSLGIKNTSRINMDLKESNYLQETKLIGGEEGFVVSGSIPEKLTAVFSESTFSSQNLKAIIKDSTEKGNVSERIGEIIEVLGVKVGTIEKSDVKNTDCSVAAKKNYLRQEVARLFSCTEIKSAPEGIFDLEIDLGEKFANRF